MIKADDEYLNRYLDGELSESEKAEIEKLISSDSEISSRFEVLKKVDRSLKKIETSSPSPDFTKNLMSLIRQKSAVRSSGNSFFYFMTGFLALAVLGITGYVLALSLSSGSSDNSASFDISGIVDPFVAAMNSAVTGFVNPQFFSLIGSLVSFTLLVSAYFFFDSHRRMAKKN